MVRTHVSAALAAVAFFGLSGSAAAQEVNWRHDYAAARKEAVESGRPLLLDFGTEACFWCKKLDATTFREAGVAKLLNERFVPVKVDAERYRQLARALQIEAYPTLVVATAGGRVVGRHTGYADAAQLTALLKKAPAPAAPKPAKDEADSLESLFPEIAAALDR